MNEGKKFVVTGDSMEMDHGLDVGTVVTLKNDDGTDTKGYFDPNDPLFSFGWAILYIHDDDLTPLNEEK